MPIGRSLEEQQLNAKLAATLVQTEVMAPMEKIGWSHGTPPPPDYTGGQPAAAPAEGAPGQKTEQAPAAVATTAKPGSEASPVEKPKTDVPSPEAVIAMYESMKDQNGLYFGKYKTIEEALKGTGNVVNMAKQAFTERDTLQEKLRGIADGAQASRDPAAVPQAPAPQATRTAAPSREKVDQAKAKLDAVLSSVNENGGVLDADTSKAMVLAQVELSEAVADFRVQEDRSTRENAERADRDGWKEVDAYMAKNHPESALFADETALFLQSKPLLSAAIQSMLSQGKRLEATEFAWTSYKEANATKVATEAGTKAAETEADLAAREQVRKELRDKALKDAGVVQGSAGGTGVHERAPAGASREEVAAAMEAMRREGDAPGSPAAQRWRALVIGPSLDPAIFGPR